MTISAKLSDTGGLEFIVSDPADTDDVGGTSDSIQAVGAESAKFSDTTAMKANAGKKIGISQVRFNTGFTVLSRSITSSVGVASTGNMIDDDITTNSIFADQNDEVVIDFGSVITANLLISANKSSAVAMTITVEISNDNSSYSSLSNLTLSTTQATQDFGSQSFRYVRLIRTDSNSVFARIFEIWAEDGSNDTVSLQLLSTSAQDSTSGTTLISSFSMNSKDRENGTAVTQTFDTVLYLTDPTHYVTSRIVSFGGQFSIPVSLSNITTVKEV